MTTIATYHEKRFDGKRSFELYPDEIVVRGKQFLQSDFETSIPLATLNPNYARTRVRSRTCWVGLYISSVCLVIVQVLVKALNMQFPDEPTGLIAVVGLGGLLLCAATIRKVEFFVFRSDAGAEILNIARSGKYKDQMQEFIDLLVEGIRRAKSDSQ